MTQMRSVSQDPKAFQKALLGWYHKQRRKLPWREVPSLYSTVVSEFMLQQTQVKTALPYFERWLRELPDFESLAQASEEKVLKLWEGLGYYSRARNLHRLAKAYQLADPKPRKPEEWRELPGIGPYSAAAITSIAFGEPAACVDGNVVRILSRLTAEPKVFRDGVDAAKTLAPLADTVLNRRDPGDHNQAMMELGATLCTRQSPECAACPVSPWCAAFASGNPSQFPRLQAKKTEKTTVHRVLCLHQGRLLLHRASPEAKRLSLMHEFPSSEQLGPAGTGVDKMPTLGVKKRSITRFQITEHFHLLPSPPSPLPEGLVWIKISALDTITLSGPHRKWLPGLVEMLQKDKV